MVVSSHSLTVVSSCSLVMMVARFLLLLVAWNTLITGIEVAEFCPAGGNIILGQNSSQGKSSLGQSSPGANF